MRKWNAEGRLELVSTAGLGSNVLFQFGQENQHNSN